MNKAEGNKLRRLLSRYADEIELKKNPYHMQFDHVIEYEIYCYVNDLCDDYYKEGQMEGYDRGMSNR